MNPQTLQMASLPFKYDLTVFPSAKSRTPQSAVVREYTVVEVPDVPRVEMQPAIQHDGYEVPHFEQRQTGIVYACNKLLYRPATDRFTGAPLGLAEFEFSVSADVAHYLVNGFRKPASRLDPKQFPTASDGSSVHAGNPLAHRALHEIIIEDWKPTWRPIASERGSEEQLAQAFLSEAIVTVDGCVFVACPEPAWAVDSYGAEAIRVRLEPYPMDAWARYFRLDRLDEARDWARRLGGSDAAPPTAEIIDGTVLARDDEWALAACLVISCRYLRGPIDDPADEDILDDDPVETVGRMVQAIREQRRGPREEEVVALLEALGSSMVAAGEWPLTGHHATDERLALIHERWTLAKAAGRGPADRQPFCADDLAALDEISRELGWSWPDDPIQP